MLHWRTWAVRWGRFWSNISITYHWWPGGAVAQAAGLSQAGGGPLCSSRPLPCRSSGRVTLIGRMASSWKCPGSCSGEAALPVGGAESRAAAESEPGERLENPRQSICTLSLYDELMRYDEACTTILSLLHSLKNALLMNIFSILPPVGVYLELYSCLF